MKSLPARPWMVSDPPLVVFSCHDRSPVMRLEAMDSACDSFDLVAAKVLARYTPEQNPHL